ncbi:MAG: hypothetical protein JWN93_1292 [Hyphomicrobiales bacterium]|nr:hypothetical protein [Hyphomicrobiales bacterium]
MISDLVKRMRSLDLMTTSLEGDDWCAEIDAVVLEAAGVLEHLQGILAAIAMEARNAASGRLN